MSVQKFLDINGLSYLTSYIINYVDNKKLKLDFKSNVIEQTLNSNWSTFTDFTSIGELDLKSCVVCILYCNSIGLQTLTSKINMVLICPNETKELSLSSNSGDFIVEIYNETASNNQNIQYRLSTNSLKTLLSNEIHLYVSQLIPSIE